jgi:hypothetical protein
MSERAEYFAILAALCANGEYRSVAEMAEGAFRIWAAGNRICKEAGLTNGSEKKP